MDKKELKTVEQAVKKLCDMLGISSEFSINETEDGVEIVLESEENGMLIGYHGETLEALQLVMSLVIAKALDKFIRVSVEVGEYKKNRMDYLKNLVEQTKEQVLAEGKGISLPNLKSWERRYVHMLASEDADITTESTGEGRDRILTIYPKN